jgi:hypothetical protein
MNATHCIFLPHLHPKPNAMPVAESAFPLIIATALGMLSAALAALMPTPAAGSTGTTARTAAERVRISSAGIQINSGPIWSSGTGSPEGAVTAGVGSIYTRTDGGASTTLYVKESGTGNTGWIAK